MQDERERLLKKTVNNDDHVDEAYTPGWRARCGAGFRKVWGWTKTVVGLFVPGGLTVANLLPGVPLAMIALHQIDHQLEASESTLDWVVFGASVVTLAISVPIQIARRRLEQRKTVGAAVLREASSTLTNADFQAVRAQISLGSAASERRVVTNFTDLSATFTKLDTTYSTLETRRIQMAYSPIELPLQMLPHLGYAFGLPVILFQVLDAILGVETPEPAIWATMVVGGGLYLWHRWNAFRAETRQQLPVEAELYLLSHTLQLQLKNTPETYDQLITEFNRYNSQGANASTFQTQITPIMNRLPTQVEQFLKAATHENHRFQREHGPTINVAAITLTSVATVTVAAEVLAKAIHPEDTTQKHPLFFGVALGAVTFINGYVLFEMIRFGRLIHARDETLKRQQKTMETHLRQIREIQEQHVGGARNDSGVAHIKLTDFEAPSIRSMVKRMMYFETVSAALFAGGLYVVDATAEHLLGQNLFNDPLKNAWKTLGKAVVYLVIMGGFHAWQRYKPYLTELSPLEIEHKTVRSHLETEVHRTTFSHALSQSRMMILPAPAPGAGSKNSPSDPRQAIQPKT